MLVNILFIALSFSAVFATPTNTTASDIHAGKPVITWLTILGIVSAIVIFIFLSAYVCLQIPMWRYDESLRAQWDIEAAEQLEWEKYRLWLTGKAGTTDGFIIDDFAKEGELPACPVNDVFAIEGFDKLKLRLI